MGRSRTLGRKPSLLPIGFAVGLGVALLMVLPFIIYDKGYFLYYGDFNVQQIAFYQLMHRSVRSGNVLWSFGTDLGANFIGSYAFYSLGSPFFWLTLPFPTSWVPYLMGPLLILKFACAVVAAQAFLSRFAAPRLALMGGLLYAFSGFALYTIFSDRFHEAMICFPLVLLGMELYMKEGRRGVFALFMFLSALCGGYLFVGQVVFLILYWIIRSRSGEWNTSVGRFFGILFEAVIGTAMAAVLLLPAALTVLQNADAGDLIGGWGALYYENPQRLFDILHSLFFPQDMPAQACFFAGADDRFASVSAWLPVFGCMGALGYWQSRRHTDWLRRLLTVSVLCMCIPLFNAAFQLFGAAYGAQWFYMPTLMMVLATVLCFEESETHPVEWKRAFGWSFGIIVFFALIVGLMPADWSDLSLDAVGLVQREYLLPFLIAVGFAVVALIVGLLLVLLHRGNRRRFFRVAVPAVAVVCLLFGWYTLVSGKAVTGKTVEAMQTYALQAEGQVTLPGDGFERIDTAGTLDNQPMFWDLPTVNCYHGVVPGSITAFYESLGIARGDASRPDVSHYALRGFLSVGWLAAYADRDAVPPQGFSYYGKQNGVALYRNENSVPMGFSYDKFITRSGYEALTEEQRELVLLKALVVEDADKTAAEKRLWELNTATADYTYDGFAADCAARTSAACDTFVTDNRGFTATATTSKATYLFFSVPYEKGWSAAVNGKPAAVMRAGIGFMAVEVPAGKVTVRFDYMTPGLWLGLYISGGALGILLLYLLIAGLISHARRKAVSDLVEGKPSALMEPRSEGNFDLYTVYKKEDPHEQ